MIVKAYVRTNKIKSDCEFEVEIDDADLVGMDDMERETFIYNRVQEEAFESGLVEIGWEARDGN